MPRVMYFDVSADNPERVIQFYENVFGWQIEKWDNTLGHDYWSIKTGESGEPGIDGGLAKREDPSQLVTPVIDVPSVDEYVAKITAEGGEIIQPKMTIPSVGYFAAFHDTEGNTFGILQVDQSAS